MYLMALFIFMILFMILWKVKFAKQGTYFQDFLSLNNSKMIKGVCAIIIVLDHLGAKMPSNIWLEPFHTVGFLAVALIFFFSGYGVEVSRNRRPGYLNHFIPNRLIGILIPLFVTNILYLVLFTSQGATFSLVQGLLRIFDFIGIDPINTTSWYIYTLIFLYILYYFSFRFLP